MVVRERKQKVKEHSNGHSGLTPPSGGIPCAFQEVLGQSLLGHCGVWSTGNITDKMVEDYLEYHRNLSNMDDDTIILE